MFCKVTKKENNLWKCALMILRDQCPPDRKHYLCMVSEDDTGDCDTCWNKYLYGVAAGTIELPEKGAAV